MPSFDKQIFQIDSLYFDMHNPRLERGDGEVQKDEISIIQILHEIADLSELINSICSNGYIDIEPLIVLANNTNPQTYTVLEGNRRLATLKLLLNPSLAEECKISIPKNCSDIVSNFNGVTAVVVKDRTDANAYIAFKHVNGAFRWDSYAKARFVTTWYTNSLKSDQPISIEDIAKKIGDSNDTVRSFISAMLILDQAEREGIFLIKEKYNRGRFGFSHLYTALGRKEYSKFLELESGWDKAPDLEPMKTPQQKERIGEILMYLYGSKVDKYPPVIKSQNPDVKNLGMIISNPVAHAILKDTGNFETALIETEEKLDIFQTSLSNCYVQLRNAQSVMDKYNGEAHLVNMAREVYEMSENIFEYVKRKTSKVH